MGPGGGPGDSDALPPAPRRHGDVEGGRPVARVSTVFTGSGDARARAFDAQSGALQRVFRGHALVINCIQVGAPPSRLPRREGRRGKRHRVGGTSSPRPRSPGPRRPRARGCPGLSVAGPGTAGPEAGTVTRRGPGAGTAGRPPTPRPAPAGARPGAVHGLARRRAAPLGRARAPARPAAAPRRRPAQPLPPLQQQGGLRRRRAAEAGLGRRHPPAAPSGDPRSERACPPVAARRRGGVAFPWCSRVSEALAWSAASPPEEGVCARAREPRPRRLRPEVPAAPPTRVSGPQL